jgi:1-aminocyclopropane-1-carboxylate deaminase/D-cysteine desulfhydrase-like pyridoxal-dependent ACC family enzyme
MIDNQITPPSDNTISTDSSGGSFGAILESFNDISVTNIKSKLEFEQKKNLLINETLYNQVVLPETGADLASVNKDIARITSEVEALTIRKDTAEKFAIVGRGINPLAEDTYNKLCKAVNEKESQLIKIKDYKERILTRLAGANSNSGVNVNVANFNPGTQGYTAPPPVAPKPSIHQSIGDVDVFDI